MSETPCDQTQTAVQTKTLIAVDARLITALKAAPFKRNSSIGAAVLNFLLESAVTQAQQVGRYQAFVEDPSQQVQRVQD